jgi:phospholipid transport system substrate-binding protein
MTKVIFSSLIFFFITFSTFGSSYNSEPKLFISELVDDAIKTLSDKSLTVETKKNKIATIAKENVDINALGLYTIGNIRKTLSKEQILKYQNLFENYFLKSLTSRLTDYSSQKFSVESADQKSATTTIVKSKLLAGIEMPEIKVDWRIYTKDPTKPLVRDLIVEGLSLARTQKEEFASILDSNNNDINALFNKLEEFIAN